MGYKINPSYDSLSRLDKWDQTTKEVITKRLEKEKGVISKYVFLSGQEGEILEIIVNVLIPQKKDGDYIKISEIIDKSLGSEKRGVRYNQDPWSGELYKKGLKELNSEARNQFGKFVEDMNYGELNDFISFVIAKGEDMFLTKFIKRILTDSISIYFSHPKSWNQIGFPGPAFPEGYSYLECGEKDEWEPEYKKNEYPLS